MQSIVAASSLSSTTSFLYIPSTSSLLVKETALLPRHAGFYSSAAAAADAGEDGAAAATTTTSPISVSATATATAGAGAGAGAGAPSSVPTIAGATCESVEVELGREKSPVSVGFETGRVARLTDGAVLASMGDSRVICAAVAAREADPTATFFPLTVDYRERASAYGKIPSTFTRREGAPKDREVLSMRVLDRAVCPLFPKDFLLETSVQAIVLASDRSQDPSVLAVNGASAALTISSIPWNGPVGAVRVSVVDGEVVLNPSDDDIAVSDITLFYAGNEHRTLMIEAAAMKPAGVPERVVAAALRAAHEAAKQLVPPQRRLAETIGKPKQTMEPPTEEQKTFTAKVAELALPRLKALYEEKIQSKSERGKAMAELKNEIDETLKGPDHALEFTPAQLDGAYLKASSRAMRDLIFDDGVRVDGRGLREIRDLAAEVQVMPVVHGSSLFERGSTQAIATVTVGSLNDVQRLDAPVGPSNKRFMLHYAFPSFSINETPRRGGLSRREIGHGALAEKSLACMLPNEDEWPFAVRVNAETMESNGSSSMAAVCSGSLALMDAGVPISEHVGAISVGLVMDEDPETGEATRHELLSDIMGLEDVLGDMDFKIAGTREGITGIQLDCKPAGIPLDILIEALDVASEARQKVIDKMEAAIPSYRSEDNLNENAPRFANVEMEVANIGKLIGPQGKNIKEIEATTGCKISINNNQQPSSSSSTVTVVGIFAPNKHALAEGVKAVQKANNSGLVKGGTYTAKVVEVLPFGWVCAVDGERGLLHVTEYSHGPERIDTSDYLPVGEELEVQLVEMEPGGGKVRFSRKALMPMPADALPRPRTPLGRGGRGSSAGVGGGGGGGGFVRNPDGSLKRPLQRVQTDRSSGGSGTGGSDGTGGAGGMKKKPAAVWNKPDDGAGKEH